MPDGHPVRSCRREDLTVGGTLYVASDPKFTDAKIFKNCRKPPKVIFVCVRKGDNVDFFQATRPQIWRNDILADVNSRTHAARMKSSKLPACIDQHGAPARE